MTVAIEEEVPRTRGAGIACAELESWHATYGLVAGITTRRAPTGPVDLGPAFAPAFRSTTGSCQPHGAAVRVHESEPAEWMLLEGFDGHATRQAGLLLTVTVADCVPVYLADPDTGAIALLHAGWRGIAAGVLEEGIRRVLELTGGAAGTLVMHCGVAIGGAHYEVSEDVLEQLGVASEGGPESVDLREVLAARATAAGVARVSVSRWCTYRDEALFWSHRRDAETAGRMVAYLGRPLT
ncbi:MAG: polyphenol oxidase family protein [Gemmatimonadetes bacterium]|nr:polyphenol oxidase family protein [Gemmatimonadota bacterium]